MRDPRVRTANVGMKVTLLKRWLTPSLCYRCPRWPFARSHGQKLDKLQSVMVARCHRIPPPLQGESKDSYFKRARLHAAQRVADCKWSDVCKSRLHTWHAHLERHPSSWTHRLFHFHGEAWLQYQRAAHGSHAALGGRTGTRATSGRAATIWPGHA